MIPALAAEQRAAAHGLGPGLDWEWQSFAEYLERLDAAQPAVDAIAARRPRHGAPVGRRRRGSAGDRHGARPDARARRPGARGRGVGHEHRACLSARLVRRYRRGGRVGAGLAASPACTPAISATRRFGLADALLEAVEIGRRLGYASRCPTSKRPGGTTTVAWMRRSRSSTRARGRRPGSARCVSIRGGVHAPDPAPAAVGPRRRDGRARRAARFGGGSRANHRRRPDGVPGWTNYSSHRRLGQDRIVASATRRSAGPRRPDARGGRRAGRQGSTAASSCTTPWRTDRGRP